MSESVTPITAKGFEFSYKAFENPALFINSIRKVYQCGTYPSVKSTYRIKRLCDAVQQELKHYADMTKQIDPESEDKEEKFKEVQEISVPIKWGKITAEELECIEGLSPADLLAIEHIADTTSFEN